MTASSTEDEIVVYRAEEEDIRTLLTRDSEWEHEVTGYTPPSSPVKMNRLRRYTSWKEAPAKNPQQNREGKSHDAHAPTPITDRQNNNGNIKNPNIHRNAKEKALELFS